MRSFRNDYMEGAHPRIIEELAATDFEQCEGYTCDKHCEHARALVRSQIGCPDARVEFVVGGTQANSLVIASALRPHEAAIAAASGHIAVHETGSIEASGHKVITASTRDGLLTVDAVKRVFEDHDSCHMVKPRLIYVSDSSEVGTIYTAATLHALRTFADEHDLLIYLDGARLAVALQAEGNDVTLADIVSTCDAFTIGGTKNGALMGECIVLVNPLLQKDFDYLMKQRGALLAKGRLLGIEYETFFEKTKAERAAAGAVAAETAGAAAGTAATTDAGAASTPGAEATDAGVATTTPEGCLYWELGRHADEMAMRLKAGLEGLGFRFAANSPTNQQFVIMDDELAAELARTSPFEPFGKIDDHHTSVRLVTSWATQPSDVDELLGWLAERV